MTGTHGSSVKWMFLLFLQFGQRMWCRGFRPTVMFTAFGAQPFDALRAVENRRIRIDAFVATDAVSGAANCSEIEALVFRKMTQEFVVVSLGFAWRDPPKNGKKWNSRFPEWLTFGKTSITLNTHPGFPPWSGNHRVDIRASPPWNRSAEWLANIGHTPDANSRAPSLRAGCQWNGPCPWKAPLRELDGGETLQAGGWILTPINGWRIKAKPVLEPRKIVPSTYF